MKTRHFDRIGNGGLTFTELGFGTAPLGNLYRAVSDEDANATLEAAWEAGCRYFDTAPLYGLGLSETRLNPFLRCKKRDDYVLSTKVGRIMRACPPEQRTGIGKFFDTPSRREVYDYSYDGVMRSFEASLERLGVDRIDILFVHDVDIFTHGSKEASDRRIEEFMRSGYYALLSLRDQGVIKAFGGGINEWQVCPDACRTRRFRPVPAGRALHAARTGGARHPSCRSARSAASASFSAGPTIQACLPAGRSPAPSTTIPRRRRKSSTASRASRRSANATACASSRRPCSFPLLHPAVVSVIPGGQRAE